MDCQETDDAAESLDFIENILSNYEKNVAKKNDTPDNNINKTKPLVKIQSHMNILKQCPLIESPAYVSKTNHLLIKSKSFNSLPNCSTPKFTNAAKEIELINSLCRSGVFDNTQKYSSTNNNESNKNSQELLTNNNKQHQLSDADCKMSPIITSSIKKIFNSQDDTPSTYSNSKISFTSDNNKTSNLDNLNRNLNFDDTIDSEKNSHSQTKIFNIINNNNNNNKLETVEEDDELLAHVEKMESNNNTKINDDSLFEVGFKTAKGGNIVIKKESLLSREKLQEKENIENNSNNDLIKNINADSFVQVGFMTAKGSNIVVKKETMMSREKIQEQDNSENDNNINKICHNNLPPLLPPSSNNSLIFSGFQTATGKKISINEEILEKNIQKLYEKNDDLFKTPLSIENDKSINNSSFNQNDMSISVDFKTCSGKKIEVKKNSIEVNKKLLEPLKTDEKVESSINTSSDKLKLPSIIITQPQPKQTNQSLLQPTKAPQVQKVLDGRHFKKPQLLDKSKMNRYVEDQPNNDKSMNSNNLNDTSLAISISNLFDNTNNKTSTSDEMEVTSKLNNEVNNNSNTNSKTTIAYLNIKRIEITSFVQNVNKNLNEKTQNIKPSENIQMGFSTGSGKKVELSEKAKEYLKVQQAELFKEPLNGEMIVDEQVPEKSYTFYKVKPIVEVVRAQWPRTYDFSEFFSDDEENEISEHSNKDDQDYLKKTYEKNRLDAFNGQTKRLNSKKNITLKPSDRSKPGYLHRFKSDSKILRQNLNKLSFIKNIPTNNSINFSMDDLSEFKFNILDYNSMASISAKGYIHTPDNGYLIPNKDFHIGLDEFYNCFIDLDGVDSKLADINWFKNHYKWIIWKLISYDFNFKDQFTESKLLNPINVINQLKYRYDVEIGNGKRSCVRKLIEKDDTSSNKLIILFLSKIYSSDNSNLIFVEMSDGWYPIKAQLDTYLTNYVKSNKLKIGHKLAIFSAELVGCPKDGCPPLEAPDELHLKIYVNAARKAKWYAKLGFVYPQRPLVVSLGSIRSNSNVGAIDVYIERIYPIMFLEKKEDGSKIYRNQKQEELYSYSYFSNNQVDFDRKLDDIDNINRHNQFQNKTSKRNVSNLLKLRVVDAREFKEKFQQSSCIITVWQNAMELKDKLIEGQRVVFMNLSSIYLKNNFQEISTTSLSTNRQTFFKFFKPNQPLSSRPSSRYNSEYCDLYLEKILCSYNEIDLTGIFLMQTTNNYQNIAYLTNLNENKSIVCICFPKNTDMYGFKDLFKYSNVIICINLKYTKKKELSRYPCLFANESSLFTQRINAYKYLSAQYNHLSSLASNQDGKNQIKNALVVLENEIKSFKNGQNFQNKIDSSSTMTKFGSNSNSSSFMANNSFLSTNDIPKNINDLKTNKLLSIAQVAELPPILSKPGIKQPGLSYHKKPFQTSLSSKNLNLSTSVLIDDRSKQTETNSRKRTSDVASDLLNFHTKPKISSEDEDDDILLNTDLSAIGLDDSNSNKRKKI